jgi:hypothetical protein
MATGLSWDEAAGKANSVSWGDAAGLGGGTAPVKPAPPTSSPSLWERIAGPQMLNAIDRVGLATGLIDPSSYKGRDPQPNAPTIVTNPAPRSTGEQFLDTAGDMATHYSPAALIARTVAERTPNAYDYDPQHLYSPEQKAQQRAQRIVDTERDAREQIELRDAADPAWKSGDGLGANLERGTAKVLGGMAGWTLGDPTSVVLPGASWWTKALGAGGIGGGTDMLLQGGEIGEGVRDRYDPVQTGMVAALGAGTTGLVEGSRAGLPALREWWAGRGVKTDGIPDDDLVAGSLDGRIGPLDPAEYSQMADFIRDAHRDHLGRVNPTIEDELARRGAGVDEARTAAAAADRPTPMNLDIPVAGMGAKRLGKTIDSIRAEREQPGFQAPPRVMPGDVPIIAAPEGAVRGDDPGAIAGLARKRAADAGVIDQGRELIDQFPAFRQILDANVPAEVKAGTIWQRMNDEIGAMRRQGQAADEAQFTPTPWEAPTPQAATDAARRAAQPQRSLIHDITMSTESAGRRYGPDGHLLRSSAGAQGEMQVMPGTSRDPGYGVRPAQNDTPEELARVGRDYIDALRQHYGGDMEKAWAAYNAGPGAVDGALSKYGPRWFEHMPAETRGYVTKNMQKLGGVNPGIGERTPETWRAADYSTADGGKGDSYSFDAIDANAPLRAKSTDNMGVAEDLTAPTSKTAQELNRPGARGEDMATGESTRPFRAVGDDPFAQPGYWEERSRRMADEATAKAQADLEAEWDRRRAAREERMRSRTGKTRFEEQHTNAEPDPSQRYNGKYGQRPHQDGDFWRTTDDGFVADKAGKPVAFRNAREAAKWAASNRMGGDFELHSWATNNERVVLRRRANSTYGQAAAAMSPEEAAREFKGSPDYDRSATPDSRGKVLEGPGGTQAGRFGAVHADLSNDWPSALQRLRADRSGEVPGAIHHPEIGPIDVVWGNDNYGLAKIVARHPEVADRLPSIVESLPVKSRPEANGNNRFVLEDDRYRAVVSPDFEGDPKQWLITAFERKGEAPGEQTSRRVPPEAPDGGSTSAGADANIGPRGENVDMQRPAPREAYEASRAEDWRSPVNNSPHGPIEARRVGPAEDTQIRAEATRRYGDSPDAWNDRAAFQNGAGGLHPTMGMPINADRARVMAAWEDGMHYGRSIEDGSAPLPSPASPASPSAGETAGPKKPRPSTRSRQAKPVDMARYIASMGGIADDEGHSLGKGRGLEDIFVPGHGKLIRKTGGNRLDHIGETLHEAGYFGPPETTPRPSIDEVLEKIDELARRKVYRPEDVAEADAQARAEAGDQERRDRLNEIESEFRARGYELMPDEAEHVLESIARGESPSEAVDNWLTSEASLAFDEFRGETGQPKFDTSFEFGANADEPGATAARRSPEDDRGAEPPRDIGRDAEPRQEAPAGDRSQSEDAGQRDAFGTRPGDERASLERQGEGRLRSDKQQKAPGSEGGLFDTRDTTADFFKAAYVSGAEGRKTPIPKGAITDGPLRDTLDWIRTNSKDEFHRDLAERLADLSEHVELRIVNDANFRDAPAHIHETYGFVAHHDREARVFINDTKYGGGLNEETVLHEAIHAAIATRFGKLRNLRLNGDLPPGVNREARRLWAIAQQSRKALSEKQGRSGLPVDVLLNLDIAHNNLDEFLTYALTDRGVASWLNSVKSTEATANVKPLTLWQHVVNLARRIVGLAPKYEAEFERIIAPHSDLLSQVDDVANNMLDHLDRIEPKEPTGKLDQALQYEFARKVEPGDEKEAKGRLLDMAFHPDAVDDAAKLVGTLTKSFGSPKGRMGLDQDRLRKAAVPADLLE